MDNSRSLPRCPIVAEECDDPGCPGPFACVLRDPVKLTAWKANRERIVVSDFSEIEGRVMAHILEHPVEEPVTTEYAKEVCKIGKGADCCRYLTMSPKGWSCEKNSSLREIINARTDMVAKADNCGGRKSL